MECAVCDGFYAALKAQGALSSQEVAAAVNKCSKHRRRNPACANPATPPDFWNLQSLTTTQVRSFRNFISFDCSYFHFFCFRSFRIFRQLFISFVCSYSFVYSTTTQNTEGADPNDRNFAPPTPESAKPRPATNRLANIDKRRRAEAAAEAEAAAAAEEAEEAQSRVAAKRRGVDDVDAWSNGSAEEAQRIALSTSRRYGKTPRGGRARAAKAARAASAVPPSPHARRAPLASRSVNALPSDSPPAKRRAIDAELATSATLAKRRRGSARGWTTKAPGVEWDRGADEMSQDLDSPLSPIDHTAVSRGSSASSSAASAGARVRQSARAAPPPAAQRQRPGSPGGKRDSAAGKEKAARQRSSSSTDGGDGFVAAARDASARSAALNASSPAAERSGPVHLDVDASGASETSPGPSTEERTARYAAMRDAAARAQPPVSGAARADVSADRSTDTARCDRTAATVFVDDNGPAEDEDDDLTQLPRSQQPRCRTRSARGAGRDSASPSIVLPPGYSVVHSLPPDSDAALSGPGRAEEERDVDRLDVTVAVRRARARALACARCSPLSAPCAHSRSAARHLPIRPHACRSVARAIAAQFVATCAVADSPLLGDGDTENTDDGAGEAAVGGGVAHGARQRAGTRADAVAAASTSPPSPLRLASEGVTQLGFTLTPDEETQTQARHAR